MENRGRKGYSNVKFEMIMGQAEQMSEYGAPKDVSLDEYKQRLDSYPTNKITVFQKAKFSEHPGIKYDESEIYAYDKVDRYKGMVLEERVARNPQQILKATNEIEILPKTKILNPIEPGIRPIPLKSKKSHKFRKRSKLGKDEGQSTIPMKSRSNKIAASSASSTPLQGQDSSQTGIDQSITTNGKSKSCIFRTK